MHQLTGKLSQYWHHIQGNLFPWLQEELGKRPANLSITHNFQCQIKADLNIGQSG